MELSANVNWTYGADTEKITSTFHTDSAAVGKVIILSLIFIVTLIGNVLVCYCGIYSPRTTAMNHLIVNLALGETLIALIVIPLKIEKEFIGEYMVAGDMMCKLLEYLESVGLGAVTLTLAMISIDRYYSIFHPLSKITRRQARYMIVISWSFPLLSASPVMYYVFGAAHQPRSLLLHCDPASTKLTRLDKTFSLVQFWAVFLLPMAVVSVVYFLIVNRLLGSQHSKVTKVGVPEKKPNIPAHIHLTVTQSSFHANLVPLSKRRALVMNMIVMVLFLFCWSPLAALYVLSTVKNPGDGRRYRTLHDFATFLAIGKLCVNPAVYSFFDSILRDQLFRCTCRIRKRNQTSPAHKHVINSEKCPGGKLSEFNVSKIGGGRGGLASQNAVAAEPLLRTASLRQATAGACLNSDRLERIIANTRRYRSLGLFTTKSSTL